MCGQRGMANLIQRAETAYHISSPDAQKDAAPPDERSVSLS
jgi:hypothetical protein